MDEKKQADFRTRYTNAAHAMQTGVAYVMEKDPSETQPKHLRVGINAAHADLGSLARLLIAKGVITEEEYLTAIAEGMEMEAASYTETVREAYGSDNINLA